MGTLETVAGTIEGKDPKLVAAMFDRVAPAYDRTNAVLSFGMSAPWRSATVKAIGAVSGQRVLDIAAGTGTSSNAIAKAGATVVGLDFSAGMVKLGRLRHPEVEFIQGDAMRLPFAESSFDAVTISFGLRNIEDPRIALAEMLRVLRPGGRLVVCEFSKPKNSLLRFGYLFYLDRVMPLIARFASSDKSAYDYLATSIREWPSQSVLADWLKEAGFESVGYKNLNLGVVALHTGRRQAENNE